MVDIIRVNNSDGKPYYTQRNNRIEPDKTCNVTSAVGALVAAGWELPYKEGVQPEDDLWMFINHDPDCLALWNKYDPGHNLEPNMWFVVLTLGINKWLGREVATFDLNTSPITFLNGVLDGGSFIVATTFTRDGHIVPVVGVEYEVLNTSADCTGKQIVNFIFDDPFGDPRTGYTDIRGNDIIMSFMDFMVRVQDTKMMKKWAIYIRPNKGE